MLSIGVIGDYDSICGFSAVGFDIFPVETGEQARKMLRRLAANDYGIIYITEPIMAEIGDDCTRYDEQPTPCIVPIPAVAGSTGFGETRMKRYVEQAVGSDMIFNDQERTNS